VSSGIEPSRIALSRGLNWLNLNASIAEVEGLLKAEYKIYDHPSGQHHIACQEYSVPQALSEHIDLIKATVHFDTKIVADPAQRQQKRAIPDALRPGRPGDGFLPKKGPTIKGPGAAPDYLRALYKLPNGTLAKSSYGLVEYTPQAYLQADLNLFYSNLAREIPSGSAPILDSIDGGVDQTSTKSFNYNGEPDLDLG